MDRIAIMQSVENEMEILSKVRSILKDKMYCNTFYTLSAKAVAMILYMLADICIARIMAKSEYGEWSYFYSILSMVFWIAWFGINISSKVHVAKSFEEKEKLDFYVKSAFILRCIVSTIFVLIYYICIRGLKDRLCAVDKYPHMFMLFLIGSIIVFFSTFSEFFKDLYIGLMDFKKNLIISCIEYGGYFLFGVGLLWCLKNVFLMENYILGIALGYGLSLLCVTIYGYLGIRKHLYVNKLIDYSGVKEILKYAMPILLMSFGALIILELDTVMIGSYYEGEQVAIYSIAKKVCSKASHINIAMATASMAEFSIINKKNILEKKKLFAKIMKLNTMITLLIVAMFLVVFPFLVKLLYGQEYVDAYKILYALTPYYVMNGYCLYMSNLLDYQKKANLRSVFYIIMIMIDVILNMIWISKFGAMGAALATSVSIVPYFIFLINASRRIFKIENNYKL